MEQVLLCSEADRCKPIRHVYPDPQFHGYKELGISRFILLQKWTFQTVSDNVPLKIDILQFWQP